MNNIYQFLYENVVNRPTNFYIYDANQYWTYMDVGILVGKFSDFLREKKVEQNDKVLIYIENSIEYVISYFAILKLGAVAVPISTTASKDCIKDIVNECDAPIILTSKALQRKLLDVYNISQNMIYIVDVNIISKLESGDSLAEYNAGDLAMLIYTSGTTSNAKGVMLSHKNLISNTEAILDYLKLNSTDSILATLPFSYSYGNSILLTHTKAGAFMRICRQGTYMQVVLSMLGQGGYTGFSTVGSYIKLMLYQDNFQSTMLSKLRYITLAGEQSSKESVLKLQEMLPELKIFIMYGQTEASARISYLEPEMLKGKIGSVGRAIKGVNIKIVDENDNEVKPNEHGEITVCGDNVMQGYWKKPEETAEVLKNGVLYTNDIGYMDEKGFLYVIGRKNDIIKYLGHRISPLEIENCINQCDDVVESAVVDYCDKEDNVKIIAFVVLKRAIEDLTYIQKKLRLVLPGFKIPSEIISISELPRTTNGKIKRKDLKDIYPNYL